MATKIAAGYHPKGNILFLLPELDLPVANDGIMNY